MEDEQSKSNVRIDIVAPVLRKRKIKWQGIYNSQQIPFRLCDADFKSSVLNGEIDFTGGTYIICDLIVHTSVDKEGETKISGYDVVEVHSCGKDDNPPEITLETIYPLQVLRMALDGIDEETASKLIHYSDRGCQYCSSAYVHELKRRRISISMTQSGDPLENPIAERANGIIKTEWLYKMKITTREECIRELERIILFYNTERPHRSIGMQTPEVAHLQEGLQKRCWRNPWEAKLPSPME